MTCKCLGFDVRPHARQASLLWRHLHHRVRILWIGEFVSIPTDAGNKAGVAAVSIMGHREEELLLRLGLILLLGANR